MLDVGDHGFRQGIRSGLRVIDHCNKGRVANNGTSRQIGSVVLHRQATSYYVEDEMVNWTIEWAIPGPHPR